jgi:hypothetical protein
MERQMSKYSILGFIAVLGLSAAAALPARAEGNPCQRFAEPAGNGGCLLIADHPPPQGNDGAAIELYRRGVARARRGESHGAFGDFNRALELDPGLSVAY